MKNQKGVTLIALVVTIIVLIILAGVSIAILTGDNGIITRSKEAKKAQIEGEVRDTIIMAIASAKFDVEKAQIKDTTYKASAHLTDIVNSLKDDLGPKQGASGSKGYTITKSEADSTTDPATPAYVTINYWTQAYSDAVVSSVSNATGGAITCRLIVNGNSVELDTEYDSTNHSAWVYSTTQNAANTTGDN